MSARRAAYLLLLLGWSAAAQAQFPLERLGPADDYERELAPRLAVPAAQSAPLLAEAARRRAARDHLSEPAALAVVHRKLGLLAFEQRAWKLAESHFGAALQLATSLADAPLIADLLLERFRARYEDGNRHDALVDAQEAWALTRRIGDAPRQVRAGLAIAEIYRVNGRITEADPFFEEMLALPGVDHLALEMRRAEHAGGGDPARAERLWAGVAQRARARGDRASLARALDLQGYHASLRSAWAEAVAHFAESEQLASDYVRLPTEWYDYSRSLSGIGDYAGARRALERALATINPATDPKVAADLEDARATLLARFGEHAAAYEALRRVQKLRTQASTTGVRMAAVRMVPMTPVAKTDQASVLAAARAELREAELSRARLNHRLALIATSGALLVAGALGLAFFYKRRAAQALALARDAAELRAERTHWQMLRYQLNPHFLYNSLASLSGLIATDPVAARRMVGRLSDFSRLALQRAEGDLRTVAEEVQLLQAFLDIEEASAGGALRSRFEVAADARSCLLPPLLLQPLVENALKYGDATTSEQREIVVSIRRTAAALELEVANSGAWVEATANSGSQRRGSGLGLANVRERVARLAPGAGLVVDHAEPGWVKIRLTLPLLAGESPSARAP